MPVRYSISSFPFKICKGASLIINGFCGSAEFTAICNDYGIEPGSVAIPQGAAVIWEGDILEEAKKLPDERIGVAVSADESGGADEVAAARIAALAAGADRNALIAEFETSVEFRVVLARFGL